MFGGYGRFDDCCYKITKEFINQNINIHTIFVTPYIDFSYGQRLSRVCENNLYDEIIYPPIETVPLKFAIAKRNEYIVDNSDVVIIYVSRTYGGTYKAMNYAIKKNKIVINVFDLL